MHTIPTARVVGVPGRASARRVLACALVALFPALGLHAQAAPDAADLTRLLNEFLAGASRDDAAIHDRFWADDLIYTGSSGRRIGKADILRDVRSAPAPKPGDPTTIYTAEDIRIQQYGDTAVVAFRLVGTTEKAAGTDTSNYLNTGTLLKRAGKWQAVSWQATRMPRPEAEIEKEVAAAEAALHRAMLSADVKALEALMDDSFVWMQRDGKQVTRQQLIDQLRAGQLKYAKLETSDVRVAAHGDTAVVRGVSSRQRSTIPGSGGSGDASPFTAFFTLTFVNQGGSWLAVAMHTSRP